MQVFSATHHLWSLREFKQTLFMLFEHKINLKCKFTKKQTVIFLVDQMDLKLIIDLWLFIIRNVSYQTFIGFVGKGLWIYWNTFNKSIWIQIWIIKIYFAENCPILGERFNGFYGNRWASRRLAIDYGYNIHINIKWVFF